MYDAMAEALPIAAAGKHEKKAILVISDGNDHNSTTSINEPRQAVRESEVLVYALGVDGSGRTFQVDPRGRQPNPLPIPFPFPRGRGRGFPQIIFGPSGGSLSSDEHVNAEALRRITDDTGGRTEIVHGFKDLDVATERIADELSKQVLRRVLVDTAEGWPLARDSARGEGPEADGPRPPRIRRVVAGGLGACGRRATNWACDPAGLKPRPTDERFDRICRQPSAAPSSKRSP